MDENRPLPKSGAVGESLDAAAGMSVAAACGYALLDMAWQHGWLAISAAAIASVFIFLCRDDWRSDLRWTGPVLGLTASSTDLSHDRMMAQPRSLSRIACAVALATAGVGLLAVPIDSAAGPFAWLCVGPLIGAGIGTLYRRPLLGAAIGLPAPVFAVILIMLLFALAMSSMPSPGD